METHLSDPLGQTLFVLAHLRALCFTINRFYLFPSIVDDIINPSSIVSFIYEHFQTEFFTIKNVQRGHLLSYHVILTPRPNLPPH
jgi:hypothetical protein